jgi:hypothetical protein
MQHGCARIRTPLTAMIDASKRWTLRPILQTRRLVTPLVGRRPKSRLA